MFIYSGRDCGATARRRCAEIRVQPRHAAQPPKQVTFGWSLVDELLGAAAHCEAAAHLETKNSINYLEIRMNVFSFQRTPLHLSLSLSLCSFSCRGILGEFRNQIHLLHFVHTTRSKHYFPRPLQLPKKIVFVFAFCTRRRVS